MTLEEHIATVAVNSALAFQKALARPPNEREQELFVSAVARYFLELSPPSRERLH